jgi:hypothetical protein
MRIIKRLAQSDAVNLLCKHGSRDEIEEEWTKDHSSYLVKSGRVCFAEVRLNKSEFMNLVFNGDPNIKQLSDLGSEMEKQGFKKDSYLFLRDLNENESGSFYVENGKHRVTAYRNLIKIGAAYSPVSAVLFSRSHQLQ